MPLPLYLLVSLARHFLTTVIQELFTNNNMQNKRNYILIINSIISQYDEVPQSLMLLSLMAKPVCDRHHPGLGACSLQQEAADDTPYTSGMAQVTIHIPLQYIDHLCPG